MIDFLNLTENKSNCECLKLGHSMQLLPLQYDPYLLYVGDYADKYPVLASIDIINIMGEVINISSERDIYNNYIELKNINYDDYNHVILRLTLEDSNEDQKLFYSDPIKISSYNKCKTTRVNFKCLETDKMQSISFPFWYIQDKRAVELESAYQISVKNQMSYATANAKYKVYKTSFMSVDAINKLSDALIMPFVYFNYKRVNLYDAIEIPEVQADERFGETTINVIEYKGIGNNDITPILYIGTELNNNYIVTEDNNFTITE